jgi:hypothetical protein
MLKIILCVDVVPIPVAVQSKVWVCGHLFAGIVGESWWGMDVVSCEYCVLSGRGLSDGPFTNVVCLSVIVKPRQ